MVSAKIKKTLLVTAIALMGFTSVAQGADMAAKMNSMFNSLSNTTKPGAFETSARGVVSGGSLVVRNQISSVNFASMQAPSINSGCGGIDFFGGSFSFISADQLVEFLKNVASNAIGYAFKQALNAVCPVCVNILNDLQNLANAVNSMNANSCQLAEGIVTDVGDFIKGKEMKNLTDLMAAGKGLLDDVSSSFNKTMGKSGAQAAKEDETNTVRDIVDINFAYKASKDAGSVAMFSGGSEKTSLEFLMSLTGTVVQRLPDKSTADDAMPIFQTFPPTLSFKDFVEGTYATGSTGDTRAVVVYKCDTTDKCLNPSKENSSAYKGLRTLIVEKLTTPGATTNLPHIYRNTTTAITDEQKGIVSFVGGNVAAYIRSLAMEDEGTAIQFILDTAPIIAGQVAYENGQRIFQEVQNSFRSLDKSLDASKAQQEMAKAYMKFSVGYQEYIATYGGMDKLVDYYSKLMMTAKSANSLRNDQRLGKK